MCGIVGMIGAPGAAREVYTALATLQHRGQDAAGILTYDTEGFHRVKNLGLVDQVFNADSLNTLTGHAAIGHTRYSTAGRGDLIEVQPFILNYPFGIALVHNGNLVNAQELAGQLKTQDRRHLLTQSDTEVLLNLFAQGLVESQRLRGELPGAVAPEELFETICASVERLAARAKGSYSVCALIADHGLLAFRDPHAIRPLMFGKRVNKRREAGGLDHAWMVASESVSLTFNGFEDFEDLAPGEILFVTLDGQVFRRQVAAQPARPCMFEWVYFASAESTLDGIAVYQARLQLGRQLAARTLKELERRGVRPDIIVPVPESSRIAAIALSEELQVPYREVLIKNRYIKRTFILDSQDKRQQAVSLKLSPVRSEIEGKKVLLVDDSIVRGTTSKRLVELVRRAGAREVYFVSTCPPIRYPCYYGIDFADEDQLIAHNRNFSEIEKELGADVLIYQDLEGLVAALHTSGKIRDPNHVPISPCMACLTGQYPVDVTAGKAFGVRRRSQKKGDGV